MISELCQGFTCWAFLLWKTVESKCTWNWNYDSIFYYFHILFTAIFINYILYCRSNRWPRRRHGRNRMVAGYTTTCAISVYHHYSCEFKSRSLQGVLDTTLCDKVCQLFVAGWWFSLGTPVSSTNKTDGHDITEMLLNVALNTSNLIIGWPMS